MPQRITNPSLGINTITRKNRKERLYGEHPKMSGPGFIQDMERASSKFFFNQDQREWNARIYEKQVKAEKEGKKIPPLFKYYPGEGDFAGPPKNTWEKRKSFPLLKPVDYIKKKFFKTKEKTPKIGIKKKLSSKKTSSKMNMKKVLADSKKRKMGVFTSIRNKMKNIESMNSKARKTSQKLAKNSLKNMYNPFLTYKQKKKLKTNKKCVGSCPTDYINYQRSKEQEHKEYMNAPFYAPKGPNKRSIFGKKPKKDYYEPKYKPYRSIQGIYEL